MDAQEYLNSIISSIKVLSEKTNIIKQEHPEYFTSDVSNVENIEDLLKSSLIINDLKTSFEKVADFLYFCNKLDIEIDKSVLGDVSGLSSFVTSYNPYESNTSVNSNGELNIIMDNYSEKLDMFKKTYNALEKITNDKG